MKGVKRTKNQCRIVLTIEVEALPNTTSLFPSHQKDVVDYLRDNAELPEIIHLLKMTAREHVSKLGVIINSQSFEVTK